MVASLRFNPDVIAVGEMRDIECYSAVEASLTGHTVVSTVHAGAGDSAADYRNPFFFVKGSIASGAKMHSSAKILVFTRDIQAFITAPGGNKNRPSTIHLSVFGFHTEVIVMASYLRDS